MIKKLQNNLRKNKNFQKGSALVIALLLIGVLLTLTLGLGSLVMREVRITNDVIDEGKAYYAAEAGIESGLLDIALNLDGYEVENGGGALGEAVLSSFLPQYEYSVGAKTKAIPYIDTELISPTDIKDNPLKTFNVLNLNDAVMIPLYTIDENGKEEKITNFTVQYFAQVKMSEAIALSIGEGNYRDIDVLRWKITGFREKELLLPGSEEGSLPSSFISETIGDYLPVFPESTAIDDIGELIGDDLSFSCFGTENNFGEGDYPDFYDSSLQYKGTCAAPIYDYAREAFLYKQVGDDVFTETFDENNRLTIKEFLSDDSNDRAHKYNYLTIMNVFNPDILEGHSSFDKYKKARIYYRVIFPEQEGVRETLKIKSKGESGGFQQKIEVLLNRQEFLPVFNFSLYRTDVSDNAESASGFQ